ncbi:hypothetical protein DFH08DRAFT_996718 [Mycena albidolilacea]|uniref:Uncharacterized protein n=1 Tax=Mycena albidolilacea TaxID=1033008 RepID=A0AAD7A4Y0_9AGAR|nr:hypothetical protein DFH08DRAFT_996718 [Mycena albidolilacea]
MSPSPSLSSYSLSLNPSHNASFFSPPATQSERGIFNGQSPSAASLPPRSLSLSPISRRASSQTPSSSPPPIPRSLSSSQIPATSSSASSAQFQPTRSHSVIATITVSTPASSQTLSSSSAPVSGSPSLFSKIPTTSSSTRPRTQPISISSSFSVNARPSASLPQNSSVSIAHSHSQATSLTHRPGVIAVIAATSAASETPSFSSTPSISSSPVNALPFTSLPQSSSPPITDSQSHTTLLSHRPGPGVIGAIAVMTVVAVFLLSFLAFFLYRRQRRIHQIQVEREKTHSRTPPLHATIYEGYRGKGIGVSELDDRIEVWVACGGRLRDGVKGDLIAIPAARPPAPPAKHNESRRIRKDIPLHHPLVHEPCHRRSA